MDWLIKQAVAVESRLKGWGLALFSTAVGAVWMGSFATLYINHGETLGVGGSVYGALALFALDGDPMWFADGVPGGLVLLLLSIAAVICSLIGVGGLINLARAVVERRPRAFGGHAVILGAGRVGRQWGDYLLQNDRTNLVVFVDRLERPYTDEQRSRFVVCDVEDRRLVIPAAVESARVVVVATGDDMTNLRITETLPEGCRDRVLCRIGSHALIEYLQTVPDTPKVFNPYEALAERTFRSGDAGDGEQLVVCGFGRFGQAVVRRGLAAGFKTIHVIDERAFALYPAFLAALKEAVVVTEGEQSGLRVLTTRDGITVNMYERTMLDREVWSFISNQAGDMRVRPVICTDRDQDNLASATHIKDWVNLHGGTVFVRQSRTLSRTVDDVEIVSVEAALGDSLGAWYEQLTG